MGKYLEEFYRAQSRLDHDKNGNELLRLKQEYNQLLQKEQALEIYLSAIGYPAMMTDPKLTEWRSTCYHLSEIMNHIEQIRDEDSTLKEWTEGFSEI
ncbi:MAG: hypothetical protein K9N46_05385 [Candidatus Marinimicrobia bacterium]|nr:hypothetical protein [Candidatus Neomarinimicrobiota bacterium]MCF7880155.1 hypothetical protein [Candidatus Neomarinimicrobiota bacterium]